MIGRIGSLYEQEAMQVQNAKMMAMCLQDVIDTLSVLAEEELISDAGAARLESVIDAYIDKGIFEPRTPVMATPLRDMFQPLQP